MDKAEVMGFAVRLKSIDKPDAVQKPERKLDEIQNKEGKPATELHLWSACIALCQHRAHDRPDDVVHSHHADRHRLGERDECDADGCL